MQSTLEPLDSNFIDHIFTIFNDWITVFSVSIICGDNFREHVDITYFLFNRRLTFKWCNASMQCLQTSVQSFQNHARADFGMYQASTLLAQEWHALHYLRKAADSYDS